MTNPYAPTSAYTRYDGPLEVVLLVTCVLGATLFVATWAALLDGLGPRSDLGIAWVIGGTLLLAGVLSVPLLLLDRRERRRATRPIDRFVRVDPNEALREIEEGK